MTRNGFHLNEAENNICREINSKIEEKQEAFR